jgi:hypothetical protein
LYAHTKGVSNPGDSGKKAWRDIMTRHVIKKWEQNLAKLAEFDAIGVNWQDSPNLPHYQGNFWMARADWIASLDPPANYKTFPDPNFANQPWARMHAEAWLGSKPWHHIESLRCRNARLFDEREVFEIDQQDIREEARASSNGPQT